MSILIWFTKILFSHHLQRMMYIKLLWHLSCTWEAYVQVEWLLTPKCNCPWLHSHRHHVLPCVFFRINRVIVDNKFCKMWSVLAFPTLRKESDKEKGPCEHYRYAKCGMWFTTSVIGGTDFLLILSWTHIKERCQLFLTPSTSAYIELLAQPPAF